MYGAAKVGAGVAGACGALVLGLVVLAGGTGSSVAAQGAVAVTVLGQLAADECVASGPVPSLSGAQATNAETIVAAALTLGAGEEGAQIALMVAYTESSLENLGPELGNDGSLGLFQQRVAAGWGTASEEEDPTDAAGMFVERLLTRSALAEHRAVGGGARRAGLGLQRSAVAVEPRFVGGRRQLQGELDAGRHILGSHRRIGGQHGLRWGERRRAGRSGQLLRIARGLRHPAGRHTG